MEFDVRIKDKNGKSMGRMFVNPGMSDKTAEQALSEVLITMKECLYKDLGILKRIEFEQKAADKLLIVTIHEDVRENQFPDELISKLTEVCKNKNIDYYCHEYQSPGYDGFEPIIEPIEPTKSPTNPNLPKED